LKGKKGTLYGESGILKTCPLSSKFQLVKKKYYLMTFFGQRLIARRVVYGRICRLFYRPCWKNTAENFFSLLSVSIPKAVLHCGNCCYLQQQPKPKVEMNKVEQFKMK
jgi:hypothetical protein